MLSSDTVASLQGEEQKLDLILSLSASSASSSASSIMGRTSSYPPFTTTSITTSTTTTTTKAYRDEKEENNNIIQAEGCTGLEKKMNLLRLNKKDDEKNISYERRNSEPDTTSVTTLTFEGISLKIQNIDDDMTSERLKEEFSRFGYIMNCKIILPSNNDKRRKYAVLSYRSPAEAAKAISYFNGKVISSNIISVTFMSQQNIRRRKPSTPTMQKMGQLNFVCQQSRFQPGAYYSPRSTRSPRSVSMNSMPKSQSMHSFPGKHHNPLPGNHHNPLRKTFSS